MKLLNSCVIHVPRQNLWDYLIVVPNVASCLPGVEEMNALDASNFEGTLTLKVGVIRLGLRGKITVELIDSACHAATLVFQEADHRISGRIQGKITMSLEAVDPEETRLTVETDLNLLGKIGEFGYGIIQKKADQILAAFASNVAVKIIGEP